MLSHSNKNMKAFGDPMDPDGDLRSMKEAT
jgi:hypothetical protein